MIRIGIIGAAEIAHRMFMPALLKSGEFECVGVATKTAGKGMRFSEDYGVSVINDYRKLVLDKEVDVIYIPLPPALHYQWAKLALENDKHVFLEKPFTTSYAHTKELVELAKKRELVLQENYMFQYHSQLQAIKNMIASGKIGELRMIKSSFGFPIRTSDDFRYSKELGGGALFDVGGYVIKLAYLFLGDTIKLQSSSSCKKDGFEVDTFGAVSFVNKAGLVCQGAYGLDCSYQCLLDIWGSKGRLFTNRIFTAPENLKPVVIVENDKGKEEIILSEDSHFFNSIKMFGNAIDDKMLREKMYDDLLMQAKLVDDIRNNNIEEDC